MASVNQGWPILAFVTLRAINRYIHEVLGPSSLPPPLNNSDSAGNSVNLNFGALPVVSYDPDGIKIDFLNCTGNFRYASVDYPLDGKVSITFDLEGSNIIITSTGSPELDAFIEIDDPKRLDGDIFLNPSQVPDLVKKIWIFDFTPSVNTVISIGFKNYLAAYFGGAGQSKTFSLGSFDLGSLGTTLEPTGCYLRSIKNTTISGLVIEMLVFMVSLKGETDGQKDIDLSGVQPDQVTDIEIYTSAKLFTKKMVLPNAISSLPGITVDQFTLADNPSTGINFAYIINWPDEKTRYKITVNDGKKDRDFYLNNIKIEYEANSGINLHINGYFRVTIFKMAIEADSIIKMHFNVDALTTPPTISVKIDDPITKTKTSKGTKIKIGLISVASLGFGAGAIQIIIVAVVSGVLTGIAEHSKSEGSIAVSSGFQDKIKSISESIKWNKTGLFKVSNVDADPEEIVIIGSLG
jgi:hypothetical protein